jgi:hypothetical protein
VPLAVRLPLADRVALADPLGVRLARALPLPVADPVALRLRAYAKAIFRQRVACP